MTDKKSLPEQQKGSWEDSTNDDRHQQTYYIGDGDPGDKLEEDDEIRPIDEVSASPNPPKSQALLDIQEAGMTPEEAAKVSKELAANVSERAEKTTKKSEKENNAQKGDKSGSGAENLAVIARFRWIFLLVLSLVSVAVWAGEAFISKRPYNWEAAGWLALTVVLTIPTLKFLRLQTISGLAAFFWAGSFFISALYGPTEFLFGNIPAALNWAGLLTLIMLWMGVAIWRKLGRYRIIDLVLAIMLIYAALAPIGALVSSVTSGAALALNFETLNTSPSFFTGFMPWLVWPMTITVALILPLCAFFSLWDQFSAFRRRGGRHGGNFFLALAFIALIPYAFLSYDQAVNSFPQKAQAIRSIWPSALPYAREHQTPRLMTPAEGRTGEDKTSAEPPTAPPVAVTPSIPDQPSEQLAPIAVPKAEHPSAVPPEPDSSAVESVPLPVPQEMAEPPILPSTLEEKLQATAERLEDALARITELEREIKLLKQPDLEETKPAPPISSEENMDMVGGNLAEST